jgi:hypothetical protein
MMMSENENKIVNDLHEEIMDELRGEHAAIQVKVAFAVLATVLINATRDDPKEVLRAASDLQQLMNLFH